MIKTIRTNITESDEYRNFVTEQNEKGDNAIGIILADLDDNIHGVAEYVGDSYILTFYYNDEYLGTWDLEPEYIEDVNVLDNISAEVDASFSGLKIETEAKYNPNINDTSTLYKEMQQMLADAGLNDKCISLDDLFNCFNIDKLKELYDYISSEYESEEVIESKTIKTESLDGKDVVNSIEYIRDAMDSLEKYVNANGAIDDKLAECLQVMFKQADIIYENTELMNEATSGIGGAYTTKAIDLVSETNNSNKIIKEDSESKTVKNYLDKIDKETSNVELVNILHAIRANKGIAANDRKELEDKIRNKVKSIKNEAVTEFYGKEWTDEEIKKAIDVAKENPEAVGYIDPNECASPFNYNEKTYYVIGEGKEITFDGKECVVFLTVDEELNRYLSYFEVSYSDEGDGESGPQELTMDYKSDVPYKVVNL